MDDTNVGKGNIKPIENPKAVLEMRYIKKYLLDKGYTLDELAILPERETVRPMSEATQFASLKQVFKMLPICETPLVQTL